MTEQQLQALTKAVNAAPRSTFSIRSQVEALTRAAESYGYTVDVTGDATQGDEICWIQPVFSGSFGGRFRSRQKFEGYTVRAGIIERDSYGADKQQHTFTLREFPEGRRALKKGRTLYKIVCLAKPRDRAERQAALEEKHERGDQARRERAARLEQTPQYL